MFKVKRVYEPPEPGDGARFLVERLWPRGMKKESLRLDGWLKDVAPSDALRRWFSHDPAKWEGFRHRYFAELDGKPEALGSILEAARLSDVTLFYSARDTQHNSAVALKAYLEERLSGRKEQPPECSSPPCYAHEIDSAYMGFAPSAEEGQGRLGAGDGDDVAEGE